MLGSSRPSKKRPTIRRTSGNSVLCRKESKLEDIILSLNLRIAQYPEVMEDGINDRKMSSTEVSSNFGQHDHVLEQKFENKLLKLNVGGTSYRFKPETIMRRCNKSRLHRFIILSHEKRLGVCDSFIDETQEYFFERSAQLFESIYQYYISGICHKPRHVCVDVFVSELFYWNIQKALFAQCCWPEPRKEPTINDRVKRKTADEFTFVRFGKYRRAIWNLIEVPESSLAARAFACLSIIAVLLSIAIMIVSSIPEFQIEVNVTLIEGNNNTKIITKTTPHPVLDYIEYACIAWFTAEYMTKMVSAANRKHAFFQILNLIDLIAIVPFYFELTLHMSGIDTTKLEEFKGALLMMRILRVSRVIRIFKLGRYSSGLRAFARTLSASTKQLSMLGVVLTTGIMFFSTLVYTLEKDVPGTDFLSIPAAFWWCIVTMTTVGYGDMVPQTVAGKLVGSGAIACGVLVLALPITIIVDNFMKVHETDDEIVPASHPFLRRRNIENDDYDSYT